MEFLNSEIAASKSKSKRTETCRFCLKTGKSFKPIYQKESLVNDNDLAKKCAVVPEMLKFKPDDQLTLFICPVCLRNLTNAYNFHQKALSSYRQLLRTVYSFNEKPIIPEQKSSFRYIAPKPPNFDETNREIQPKLKTRKIQPKISYYSCSKCTKTFNSRRGLRIHENSHLHSEQSTAHFCNMCQRQFRSTEMYRYHQGLHRMNICYFCNKIFVSDAQLIEHISEKHPMSRNRFPCTYCDRSYASRKILMRHNRTVHMCKYLLYFCGLCNNRNVGFITPNYLIMHLKKYHSGQQETTSMAKFTENNLKMANEVDAACADSSLETTDLKSNCIIEKSEMISNGMIRIYRHSTKNIDQIESNVLFKNSDTDMITSTEIKEQFDCNAICFKCPKCSAKFNQQMDLSVHLGHEHNESSMVCNDCGASFNRSDDLIEHRREHQIENYVEQIISIDGMEISALDRYLNTESTACDVFFCRLCSQKFAHEVAFRSHTCDITSSKNVTIECTMCPETFSTMGAMYTHRKTHQRDMLCCTLCDKRFTTIGGLKYHLKIHTGVKAFTCPYCGKRFPANINLNAHLRNVHALVKPIQCTMCTTRFATKDHMQKHVVATHTKERKFECKICKKRFYQKSHLTQHIIGHTDIKRFGCDVCPKAYTSITSLKKHLSKHHKC